MEEGGGGWRKVEEGGGETRFSLTAMREIKAAGRGGYPYCPRARSARIQDGYAEIYFLCTACPISTCQAK